MNPTFPSLILCAVLLTVCSRHTPQAGSSVWNEDAARRNFEARHDPETWDMQLLEHDIENLGSEDAYMPFARSAFPVPVYNSVIEESFTGTGNIMTPDRETAKHIGDKTLLYNAFFNNRNVLNRDMLPDGMNNEVFFMIIVLTDFIDEEGSHAGSEIVSRNHPDIIGQGYFRTVNRKIDYVAFMTAERRQYAIVNMRLMDLDLDRCILVAPRRDGSLRFRQEKMPLIESSQADAFAEKLLSRPEIKRFFLDEGNI